MSMNKFFKEIDYIETFMKKRKLDAGFKSNLKLLAKYYKHLADNENSSVKIESEEDLEELLYEFCNKKCSDWFNKVLHYKMIDNAVKFGMNESNKMIQIESVNVSKSEFEYINNLSDEFTYLDKKILFTMLVINKASNIRNNMRGFESNYYFSGGEYGYKQLMDVLGEKLTRTYKTKGVHETIKKFNDYGLTRTTNKLSLELLYLKEIEYSNEVVVEVLDFDDIGMYWDYLMIPDKFSICKECKNSVIKITTGNKLYCKYCQYEIDKRHKREWKNKSRGADTPYKVSDTNCFKRR